MQSFYAYPLCSPSMLQKSIYHRFWHSYWISLSCKHLYNTINEPAERRKYLFRYSVYIGESSCDLKLVTTISAETYQMVLNLLLASISITNFDATKILVFSVTTQTSAPEAKKPKIFWTAAFDAQKFSGRSARMHFSQQMKKVRNLLQRHIKVE